MNHFIDTDAEIENEHKLDEKEVSPDIEMVILETVEETKSRWNTTNNTLNIKNSWKSNSLPYKLQQSKIGSFGL